MQPVESIEVMFGGLSTRIREALPYSWPIRYTECLTRNGAGNAFNLLLDLRRSLRRSSSAPNPRAPEAAGGMRIQEAQGRYYAFPEDVAYRMQLPARLSRYRALLDRGLGRAYDSRVPLKIVFLLSTLERTGGVISIVQLVNDMIRQGLEVRVVVMNPNSASRLELLTEPIVYANRRALLRNFPKADMVIGTFWSTMYVLVDLFLARPSFVPAYFVQDFEALFYPEKHTYLRKKVEDTYGLTPYCFAKTDWICDAVRSVGGKIAKVPPAIDLDLFSPARVTPSSEKKVLLTMLRPNTPYRGIDTARQVLAALSRSRDDIEIHTFGCSDSDLAGYDFPFHFTNHGKTANEDLPALYQGAYLYADFSRFHGFGRTIAEAMACGTPAVITESGGVSEFAIPGENCLMAPSQDADALAMKLGQLLDSPELREEMASKCRKSVLKFDRQGSAKATIEYLVSCIQSGGA